MSKYHTSKLNKRFSSKILCTVSVIAALSLCISTAQATPFNQANLQALTKSMSQSIPQASQQPVNTVDSSQTDSDKRGIQVGLNVMMTGSPYDVDENIVVLPGLFYDNDKAYVRGSQIGGYFIKDRQNEVTGFFQPAGFSFDPDDAKGAQRDLDEREWSGMLGVSYLRRTPIGGFRAQVATDVIGNSKGTLAKLAYLARVQKNNWTIYPSVGVEWANNDYNDYYYGVSDKESAKTGIPTYDSDSSISPYVSINANYDVNDDWALFLGQNVSYLADEQSDSPIVDNRTTYRTTVGLLYKF